MEWIEIVRVEREREYVISCDNCLQQLQRLDYRAYAV